MYKRSLQFAAAAWLCAAAALVVACNRDLESPSRTAPAAHARRVVGVVEITFRNIGSPKMTSSAIVGSSVAEVEAIRAAQSRSGTATGGARFDLTVPKNSQELGDSTIQLRLDAAGEAEVNGTRYFEATYDVRNAQSNGVAFDTERDNLTFLAVGSPKTIDQSPVLVFDNNSGVRVPEAVMLQLKPSGMVDVNGGATAVPASPDVMQVFTEQEVAAISAPPDVTNPFPYGFIVRRTGDETTRELPADPAVGEFDGVVTFAFRIPKQADPANDPTTITVLMLALDDAPFSGTRRMTQSFEEQTPAGAAAAAARAMSLNASQVRLLPGGSAPGLTATTSTRLFCSVRTAGTAAAPTANLITNVVGVAEVTPSPYTAAGGVIDPNASIHVRFAAPVTGASPSNIIVRGLISGLQFRGQAYSGDGTTTISTPPGAFLPGEEVEVVVTEALSTCAPWVGRLRVRAPTPSSGVLAATAQSAVAATATAVGDFDGNGTLDLAVVSGSNVTIYSGDGSGGFTAGASYPMGTNPGSIVAADFNNDGILDLAAGNGTNVTVRLGTGAGTFGPAADFPAGGTISRIVVGDLNGDGRVDIASANLASNSVSVLLGNGDGTFHSLAPFTSPLPSAVAIGDMNEDGTLDLVVTEMGTVTSTSNIHFYLGRGDGTFRLFERFLTYTSTSPIALALGDVNEDGHLDAVSANNALDFGNARNWVNFGDGNGGVPAGSVILNAGNGLGQSVALGDMNGDGLLDIVFGNAGNQLVVMRNASPPGALFPTLVPMVTTMAQAGASQVLVADLNHDGRLDVVVGNRPLPAFLGQP